MVGRVLSVKASFTLSPNQAACAFGAAVNPSGKPPSLIMQVRKYGQHQKQSNQNLQVFLLHQPSAHCLLEHATLKCEPPISIHV